MSLPQPHFCRLEGYPPPEALYMYIASGGGGITSQHGAVIYKGQHNEHTA